MESPLHACSSLVLILVAVVGCGGASPATAGEPLPPLTPVASASARAPLAMTPADATELTLACSQSIEALEQVPPSHTPVLDVVALGGIGPGGVPLQTARHTSDSLFAKSGLLVKSGARFELVVPHGSSLRLVWGNKQAPVSRVRVTGCAGPRPWLAFAGGFWVKEPGCADVVVREGAREQKVRVAIGATCAQ